jgi:acetyltransferase-like isoleucine patch superfamily enzyme
MGFLRQIYIDSVSYVRNYFYRDGLLKKKGVRVDFAAIIPRFASDKIGRYTFIGKGVVFGPNFGSMGMFCSIGQDVIIGPNHHRMDLISTSTMVCVYKDPSHFIDKKKIPNAEAIKKSVNSRRTVIGNDVWIGSRAIVLSGVSIGDGAVIGAGAIVTKDVPPYAVFAGNPAKLIRYRFTEHTIGKLIDSRIFTYPHEKIFRVMAAFSQVKLTDSNVQNFVDTIVNVEHQ